MARLLCVAAALLLGSCGSSGYVYDAGSSGHLHPSAALCASWGQRLDTSANEGECVLAAPAAPVAAPPEAPPAPPAQAVVRHTAPPTKPRPAVHVASTESETATGNELSGETKRGSFAPLVESNYRCGTMAALRPRESRELKLVCNGPRCCLLPRFH